MNHLSFSLVLLLNFTAHTLLPGFDEALRQHLGPRLEMPVESTERSVEVTDIFRKNYQGIVSFFRAFDIDHDNGIYSLLVTNAQKNILLGRLKYCAIEECNGGYVYISNIWVARDIRGQGLGSALFKYIVDTTKASCIKLTAAPSDYQDENISAAKAYERLLHFYENLGMTLEQANKLVFYKK